MKIIVFCYKERYRLATVSRNHLVAAQQNCLRAEEYLKMNMPYWTATEKQVHPLYTENDLVFPLP